MHLRVILYGRYPQRQRMLVMCSISGCNGEHYARGWCCKHYKRWHRSGDPNGIQETERGTPLVWLKQHIGYRGSECLIWPFSIKPDGYAQVRFNGASTNAHRVMCMLAHGECPLDKNEAAHSCRNPKCVNPMHLRWATWEENNADKIGHGTISRKLSEKDVLEIRLLSETLSQRKIAARFGVSRNTIVCIQKGKTWNAARTQSLVRSVSLDEAVTPAAS
jgi:hypothetical protein